MGKKVVGRDATHLASTGAYASGLREEMSKEAHAVWHRDFRVTVGRRLRAARELAKMQQSDVARRLGYTAATHINEWEAGKRLPGPEKLALLIECYGTSADYIYGLRDDPDPDPVVGVQHLMAAHLRQQIDRLCSELAKVGAASVRELGATHGEVLSLCRLVLEADQILERARAADTDGWFDDNARGGAALVQRMRAASQMAGEAVTKINRAQRAVTIRGMAQADRFVATGGVVQASLFTGVDVEAD